jgi:hypothetical protein
VTARGGHDDEVATRDGVSGLAPKVTESTRDVGDFGNLDDAANLAALRTALEQPASGSAAPQAAAGDSSSSERGTTDTAAPDGTTQLRICGLTVPDGATTVAQGTGTLDGRRATVVLIEAADGTRTFDAVLEDPCELRHLP